MESQNESNPQSGSNQNPELSGNNGQSNTGNDAETAELLRLAQERQRETERAFIVNQTVEQIRDMGTKVDLSATNRVINAENMGRFRDDAEERRRFTPALAEKFAGAVSLAQVMSSPRKRGPL